MQIFYKKNCETVELPRNALLNMFIMALHFQYILWKLDKGRGFAPGESYPGSQQCVASS